MEHREYDMYFRSYVIGCMWRESLSVSSARRRFGILGKMTIQRWIRRYCPEHVQNLLLPLPMKRIHYHKTVITADSTSEDKDRRIKELELELSDQMLLNEYYTVFNRIVKEEHGLDIKKFDAELLSRLSIARRP